MGKYKTCEMTSSGMNVILQIPEPYEEDGRLKQEIRQMLEILLREQMQMYVLKRRGS